jgi:alkaline phosphatase D
MNRSFVSPCAMAWALVVAGILEGRGAEIIPSDATRSHGPATEAPAAEADRWRRFPDRVWLGSDCWANPMEDWRVVDGAAECVFPGGGRSIHLLTHELTDPSRAFSIAVTVRRVEEGPDGGGAGFRIGVQSDIGDHRANCFAAGGLEAGLQDGILRLADRTVALAADSNDRPVFLRLAGTPEGDRVRLRLSATDDAGGDLGRLTADVAAGEVLGNVALVHGYSDPAPRSRKGAAGRHRYRFTDWSVEGDAFTVDPDRRFGPILWAMHTLDVSKTGSGALLKLTALLPPLLPEQPASDDLRPEVELQLDPGSGWQTVARAHPDPDAWTATFRLPDWDTTRPVPYRVLLEERRRDGSAEIDTFGGIIRAVPTGRPLRIASLTCQNDYAFPYRPVVDNLVRLDPDLLYFSGDQIYESHGGFGIIRSPAGPAILNYLRKFHQFGWAFREPMRSRPTIVLPDDHDVFQGNVWGEAGRPMDFTRDPDNPSRGGYHQPARMVNVVHATCTSHHPDFPDRVAVGQDISVYHGDLVFGDIGFAIVADRQFKSGPERVQTDAPRADHVLSADFDTASLDLPGLVLLGDRQEAFLRAWSADWRGHRMKVLLSQTVFAGVATHHGKPDAFLKADLDCGGWPQSARNAALRALAGSRALHLNGDQHLPSLVQYGIDRQRDSIWSFCAPAIAVSYPRWWRPDDLGIPVVNRPVDGWPNTGEYLDGLGNRIFVQAVGDPEVGTETNRYRLAHQKGSGFSLVTVDPDARTFRIDAFRFLVDATDGKPGNQFPGWPVTIVQDDADPNGRVLPEPALIPPTASRCRTHSGRASRRSAALNLDCSGPEWPREPTALPTSRPPRRPP